MGNPKTPKPVNNRLRRVKRWALGLYRLGMIFAAMLCLRALPRDEGQFDPERVLPLAKQFITETATLGEPKDGLYPLLDSEGNPVGWASSTAPQARKIQGYSGASELVVFFDAERRVKGVHFLASEDTDGHVKKVRDAEEFWQQWTGKSEAELGSFGKPVVVSGATLTSEAMARGVAARFGAQGMDEWFPSELQIKDVVKQFPLADRLSNGRGQGIYDVWAKEEKIGVVLRSSRMGVSARGYNGTSDVIVCLTVDGEKILGVGFLGSRDNEPYITDVGNEVKYADGFAGKTPEQVLGEDENDSPSLFTSGASYTNQAVVGSVKEMLRRYRTVESSGGFPWKSACACCWILLGVFVGIHPLGNRSWARKGFAILSVGAGIFLGWMVSQDQLVGWGMNGFQVKGILPLLMLTAVALIVPAFTGKNVYCNRICPHGAAQVLAKSLVKKRFSLPPKIHALFSRLPWLTLLVIWGLAFFASGIPFAYFEPFETWSSGFMALIPAAILTVGLVAAFFLPQAYCHYGCPTGALLKFLTASPTAWTHRDSVAGGLVIVALLHVWL